MTDEAGTPLRINYSASNIERVYLIGVRLGATSERADLYSLVLYYEVAKNDRNRPLTHDGRIVFFPEPKLANKVLQMGDAAFRKYSPISDSVDAVYDVSEVIRLIEIEDRDPSANVVTFLNELFDFVDATRFHMPAEHKQVLSDLADHLTFHRDYGDFINREPARRGAVLGAVLWSLGAIFASSKVVSADGGWPSPETHVRR